jgi:hypothetical protein
VPDGFKVVRNLDLSGTGITTLPKGLKVGEDLNLWGCKGISTLPKSLMVGGRIYR